MDTTREIDTDVTLRAEQELLRLKQPLHIQLELLFSCLVRKRILFDPDHDMAGYAVACGHPLLEVSFRPVVTRECAINDQPFGGQQLDDLPTQRAERMVPKWLKIDYQHGEWQGEFGWSPSEGP